MSRQIESGDYPFFKLQYNNIYKQECILHTYTHTYAHTNTYAHTHIHIHTVLQYLLFPYNTANRC